MNTMEKSSTLKSLREEKNAIATGSQCQTKALSLIFGAVVDQIKSGSLRALVQDSCMTMPLQINAKRIIYLVTHLECTSYTIKFNQNNSGKKEDATAIKSCYSDLPNNNQAITTSCIEDSEIFTSRSSNITYPLSTSSRSTWNHTESAENSLSSMVIWSTIGALEEQRLFRTAIGNQAKNRQTSNSLFINAIITVRSIWKMDINDTYLIETFI